MKLPYTVKILGVLLMIFSLAQLLPALVAFMYSETANVINFSSTFAITLFCGAALYLLSTKESPDLRTKDGFIITVFFWTVLAFFGSIPIYLASIDQISYIDSLFESISGLTTTGATVLTNIEELPRSLLFYRQLLQWLGGMGIIVLAVAVLPLLGVGGMQLYRAETPGPLKGSKLTPRITETAKALWYVYLSMTAVCAISYKAFGMSSFDAICHSFSTVAIGGFSTHDQSFAYFPQQGIRYTAIIFMLLAGMNFALHFIAWNKKRVLHYFYDSEFRCYFGIIFLTFAVTSATLVYNIGELNLKTIEESLFLVVSISTTTGFLSSNYSDLPLFLPIMLLTVAFIGACAGSTGGGIKVVRALILMKQSGAEFTKLVHSSAVVSIKLSKKPLNPRVSESVWGFFSIYVLVFLILLLFLLSQGNSFITAFSAVGATLNNLGPGLGDVSNNYYLLNNSSKLALCFAMLLGRLEIFTLLIVFTPTFWKN